MYRGRNKEEEKSGKISKTEGVKEKREWIKDGVQRGEKEMELELEVANRYASMYSKYYYVAKKR